MFINPTQTLVLNSRQYHRQADRMCLQVRKTPQAAATGNILLTLNLIKPLSSSYLQLTTKVGAGQVHMHTGFTSE